MATEPAVIVLSDADVDRIAVATTAKIKAELLVTLDAPRGRHLGATLAGTYNAVQAIRAKLKA